MSLVWRTQVPRLRSSGGRWNDRVPGAAFVRRLLRRSPDSAFIRNVFLLITGTAAAQAIPIAISPVLTRLYAPRDFGVFALFTTVVTTTAACAMGSYEKALMLPRRTRSAAHLFVLAVVLALVVTGGSAVAVWGWRLWSNGGGAPSRSWLILVPGSVLVTAIGQLLLSWHHRHERYRVLASSRIWQAVSASGVQLALGAIGGAHGLLWGWMLGQGTATVRLGWLAWTEDRRRFHRPSYLRTRAQARRYRAFPRYQMVQVLLDGVRDSGLLALMSKFFGSTVLGYYAFAIRILKTPFSLIGSAITQVYYQQAAANHKVGGPAWPGLRRLLLQLGMMAIPVLLVFTLFAPSLFVFVFGPQWVHAGEYARILAPWLVVSLISSPISQLPLVLGRQREFLRLGIGYNLLLPCAFLVSRALADDITVVLIAFSSVATLYLLGVIGWIIRTVRADDRTKKGSPTAMPLEIQPITRA